MDARTELHVARTATFGCVRTTTSNKLVQAQQLISSSSSSSSVWPEPEMASPGSGTQPKGQSAAEDLTTWAQDLLELLDGSLAQMQSMQKPGTNTKELHVIQETGETGESGEGSRADSDDGDSFPALRITEVEDDDGDDGDSVLTASNSVSSGGHSSYRADLSPAPYYIVDEEEADPPTQTIPEESCTEMRFESSFATSTPTSGSRRGRTLYETLMNQSNSRQESVSCRPRMSAFSLGVVATHYSDDSSDEEKDSVCIEQIQDLDQLEKMLNESKQYEMRRRIRSQIRSLRKNLPTVNTTLIDNSMTSSSPPIRPTSMFPDAARNADFHSDFSLKAHLFSSPSGLTIDEGYSSVTSPMSPMDCSDSSFEASSPPPSTKMGDSWISGVNLLELEDEIELHKLLDHTEDIDDRKKIRNRLREVMAIHREQREEQRNRRENERENLLRKKVADADEQKRRTLAMYDAMAKSAPAGGNKTLDVNILRTGEEEGFASDEESGMKENVPSNMLVTSSSSSSSSVQTTSSSLFSYWSAKSCSTVSSQHVVTVASNNPSQNIGGEKLDLIEEAIRDRQRNCDETKKKTLAAFDKAARTAPAGSARIVDFNNVTDADIREKENTPKYTSCFQMSGGIPSAKANAPRIAPRHVEPERDLMEEAIRKRQAESDERKRRTLAAYDQAARSRPAGDPVTVYIPQNFDIEPVVVSLVSRVKDGSKPGAPSTTAPNYPRPGQQQATRQQVVTKPQPQQPTSQSQVNIKTQSSVRTVNNPHMNARPAAPPQPKPQPQSSNVSSTRTTVTTQKTVSPVEQVQQRQVTTTVTTQSSRTVQQQQQQSRQQQQRYIEESEEEEEEEELEEDY